MSSETITPKYWRPGYDTWHLPLLPILAVLLVTLAFMKSPLPAAQNPAKAVVPRFVTVVDQPPPGAVLRVDQLGEVVGRAEPATRVVLFYRTVTTPEKPLAETVADAVGVYRFRLAGFPPGSFGLRTAAVWPDGQVSYSVEIPFRVIPAPVVQATPDRKKKARPAQR